MALNSRRSSATRTSMTSHFGGIASPAEAGSTDINAPRSRMGGRLTPPQRVPDRATATGLSDRRAKTRSHARSGHHGQGAPTNATRIAPRHADPPP